MKSEVNNPNEVSKEIKYPCLMKSKYRIVLFLRESEGTCVWGSEDFYGDIGYWSSGWNMPDFSPFNGSITLSND